MSLNPVRVILLSTLVSNIGSYLIIPILGVFLVHERGLSTIAVGTIFANMIITQTVGSLFGGILADRAGANRVLVIGLAIRVVAFPLLIYVDDFFGITLACMLIWLGSGIYVPTAKASLSALCDTESKPRLLALRSTFANIGVVVGPLIGLGLTKIIGRDGLFYFSSLLFLVAAISNAFLPKFSTAASQTFEEYFRGFRVQLGRKTMWLMIYVALAFNMCHALFGLVMPIYGQQIVGEIAPQLTYTVNAIVVILLQITLATHIQLFRSDLSITLSFLLVCAACLLMSLSPSNMMIFSLAVVLYSTAEVILLLKIDFLASNIGRNMLGATFALSAIVAAVGGAVGNQGLGALYALVTHQAFWYISAVLAIFLAGIIFIFPKNIRISKSGLLDSP